MATIAEENAITADVYGREWWLDYDYATEDLILGFARSTYYAPGETVQFSIDYASAFNVRIYRLGYYTGGGGRRMADFAGTPATQPAPVTISDSNGAVTCAAWSVNVSWAVPADATPGWYQVFLSDTTNGAYGTILFCVTDTLAKQPILVVGSEATWGAAYNGYGGNNVYGASTGIGNASERALCSSYDKPVVSKRYVAQTNFFNGEIAQLRFFERFGYDVGYATCEQINNDPTVLDGRDLIVFSGHNEYVSARIRDKVAERIAAGVNVANFSANDFFWKVRYGGTDFPASDNTTGRVMWCKKDTMDGPSAIRAGGGGTPFTTQADWTGTWQDTRWTGRQPSSGLLGDRFIANGIRADQVSVPFSMKDLPIWRDCAGIAALTTDQTFTFGVGTAGMEWDFPDLDGGLRQTPLSATSVNLAGGASDINGEDYTQSGVYTHAFQVTANGSSRIFNANTTQWGWAIDDLHFRGASIATAEAIQATINILADLGAVAVESLVTASSLVFPTPVADFDAAYSLAPSGGVSLGDGGFAGFSVGSTAVVGLSLGDVSIWEEASADTTAPSVPTGLASSGITSSGFQVTWSASSDDSGVTGYQVRLDSGSVTAASGSLSHIFSGLSAETTYSVEVRAGDSAGNWSAWSTPLEVTTDAAVVTYQHFFDGRTITGIDAPVYADDLGTGGLTGMTFYAVGRTITVHGARIYNPAGASGAWLTQQVTARLHTPDYLGADLIGAPITTAVATKVHTTARTAGTWTDILFDTPVTVQPANAAAAGADIAMLSIEFPNGQYMFFSEGLSGIRVMNNVTPSPTSEYYLAEPYNAGVYFRAGSSGNISAAFGQNNWYGCDIICTTAAV